jgi:hypothetical protein
MLNHPASREEWTASLSRLLACSGLGLLLVFLAFTLADSLPVQLLNPAWQLRFTNRVVNTAVIALMGFLLLHLAVYIDPGTGLLRAYLRTARRWAMVAVIGFLLLLPLQGFATWRVLAQSSGTQLRQRQVVTERLAVIRKAIDAATSSADLQARFASFPGAKPELPAAALSLPLPQLKRQLINELQKAETRITDRLSGPTPTDVWALGQGLVRVMLASLGFALAFSAGAQTPGSSQTLLDLLLKRWQVITGRRTPGKRRSG